MTPSAFRPCTHSCDPVCSDIELTPELIVTKHTAMQRDDVHPVSVRCRWATGPSGDRTIMVTPWDLAELSREGQAIWARHEIEELRGDGG